MDPYVGGGRGILNPAELCSASIRLSRPLVAINPPILLYLRIEGASHPHSSIIKRNPPLGRIPFYGGGRGIRTPVGLRPNGFQDRLVMTASICLRTEVLYHSRGDLSSVKWKKAEIPFRRSAFFCDGIPIQRVRAMTMNTARVTVRIPWAIRVTRLTVRIAGRSVCQ